MKKLKLLLAVILFLVGTVTVSAQFMGNSKTSNRSSDGYSSFRIGYAPTTLKGYAFDREYEDSDDVFLNGHTFSINYSFAKPISASPVLWEAGLSLEFGLWHDHGNGFGSDLYLGSLNVPINIMYVLSLGNDINIYPYAGINGRLYVFGSEREYDYASGAKETKYYNIYDDNYWGDGTGTGAKRFTFGYQAGVRLGISRFFASIGYSGDFIPFMEYDENELSYKSKMERIEIGLGIRF